MPTPTQTAEIQDQIDGGALGGLPWRFAYSSHDDGDSWARVPIGEVMGFVEGSGERSEAQSILNEMIRAGSLAKGDRKDPLAPKNSQRKPVPFVKLPEICATHLRHGAPSAALARMGALPPAAPLGMRWRIAHGTNQVLML